MATNNSTKKPYRSCQWTDSTRSDAVTRLCCLWSVLGLLPRKLHVVYLYVCADNERISSVVVVAAQMVLTIKTHLEAVINSQAVRVPIVRPDGEYNGANICAIVFHNEEAAAQRQELKEHDCGQQREKDGVFLLDHALDGTHHGPTETRGERASRQARSGREGERHLELPGRPSQGELTAVHVGAGGGEEVVEPQAHDERDGDPVQPLPALRNVRFLRVDLREHCAGEAADDPAGHDPETAIAQPILVVCEPDLHARGARHTIPHKHIAEISQLCVPNVKELLVGLQRCQWGARDMSVARVHPPGRRCNIPLG